MYHSRNTSGRTGECVKAGFKSFYFHTVFQFCSDKCFLEYKPGAPPLAGLTPRNVKRLFKCQELACRRVVSLLARNRADQLCGKQHKVETAVDLSS